MKLLERIKTLWRRNSPALSAEQVANRLHRIAHVDDIHRAEMDMDDFVTLYLTGGWRIGILFDNGDMAAVVNAQAPNGQQGNQMTWQHQHERNPLSILRVEWPGDIERLQDVIGAAIARDEEQQ